MKITHDNKPYILDVQRSIELGVLKLEKPPYVPRVGDVFTSKKGSTRCVLIADKLGSGKFKLIGNMGDLTVYSDPPKSPEEVIKQFIDGNWTHKGNINDEFRYLLDRFCY